jgi:hypothetical protein|uniref:Uncharacterized protein n=1 Tax=Podoviridae sp. ctiuS14 TaxID=2827620 RepID=A0A8S5LM10_9CAUD|nr:MAG TPA: hypothetical protein [Podoviridae sp. ctiuS14]
MKVQELVEILQTLIKNDSSIGDLSVVTDFAKNNYFGSDMHLLGSVQVKEVTNQGLKLNFIYPYED